METVGENLSLNFDVTSACKEFYYAVHGLGTDKER